jgi:hypothetical protein
MTYEAADADLPTIFSDAPEVNRMAAARRRVRTACDALGLQPTSEQVMLCAIVLVAIEEDAVGVQMSPARKQDPATL